MTDNKKMHIREYGGLLEIPEKKALLWLAQRTPCWINSDHLTLLGFTAMLAAGAFFWVARWNKLSLTLAVAALAVNWLGDSLDGTLARFRNCQRPRYGYYVDHVIDLLGTTALLGGLAFSGLMSPWIALMLLAAYTLVEAETYLAVHVRQVFRLSCFHIGPTELRIILAAGTLRLLYNPWVRIGAADPVLLFDIGGIVSIAGLLTALLYSAIRNARALYFAESLVPKPSRIKKYA